MAAALTGAERRRRLAATRVYLILTQAACRGGRWEEALAAAMASGVIGMVQLREKEISDEEFAERARRVAPVVHRAGALLILNDRVGLVPYAQADGVHVGEEDLDPVLARDEVGADLLLGVSAHSAEEVGDVVACGGDYAGLGPCFPTTTKELVRAPRGPSLVAEAVPGAPIPVFPIGGITRKNVGALVEAGATRVAVGAGILRDPHPRAAAAAIAAALARR